nr:3'-5' exonuclease [Thalassobacillus sp. C254]
MTIHQSKGLEFENVYILGAVEGGLPTTIPLKCSEKEKAVTLKKSGG